MIGYIKAEEAAKRWNVSLRHVQRLCTERRIDGAVKFGTTWAIPENIPKPTRTGELKPGRKPKK
jgi:excisionase family DNA binding protein